MNDPEFLADIERRKLPVQFRSGEQLQAFVNRALDTPPKTVKTFLEIVGTK